MPPTVLAPPVDLERDHWRGSRDEGVRTLLEFGDYECPYSRMAYRNVELVEHMLEGRMRFVYRQLPLTDIHPHALAAAGFAEAAARQGLFWQMHDLLFHHQKALEVDDLRGYAAEAGVEHDRLMADLEDREHLWRRVQDDVQSAMASGARGTPTLFVDGVLHEGGYEPDVLLRALSTPG